MTKLRLSRRVGLTLLVGSVGIFLARWSNFPGGGLVGALLATSVARLLQLPLAEPPRWVRSFGRMVLGLSIGVLVNAETLRLTGEALLPVSVMIFAMMLFGMLAAWTISRVTRIPLATALCAAAPGALTGMVVLADEYDSDGPAVASVHLIRLISVVILVPSFVRTSFEQVGVPSLVAADTGSQPDLLIPRLILLLVLGMAGAYLAQRLKIPAGELLAGLVVAGISNPTWLQVAQLPTSWRLFAQLTVGAGIGATVSRDALRSFKPYAPAGLMITAFLIVTGLSLGWVLAQISSLDLVTCVVGCAPGGAETMMLLAEDLGADARLVTVMHVTRMIILTVFLPFLVRAAISRQRQLAGSLAT